MLKFLPLLVIKGMIFSFYTKKGSFGNFTWVKIFILHLTYSRKPRNNIKRKTSLNHFVNECTCKKSFRKKIWY